jgi:hypothetical protein
LDAIIPNIIFQHLTESDSENPEEEEEAPPVPSTLSADSNPLVYSTSSIDSTSSNDSTSAIDTI